MQTRCVVEETVPMRSVVEISTTRRSDKKVVTHPNSLDQSNKRRGVGVEDRRVKCDDAEDHMIKGELTIQVVNSQPGKKRRIQCQAPKGHATKVDEVHDLIYSTGRWHRTSGAELELCSMLFVLPFCVREACAEFGTLPDLNVRS